MLCEILQIGELRKWGLVGNPERPPPLPRGGAPRGWKRGCSPFSSEPRRAPGPQGSPGGTYQLRPLPEHHLAQPDVAQRGGWSLRGLLHVAAVAWCVVGARMVVELPLAAAGGGRSLPKGWSER